MKGLPAKIMGGDGVRMEDFGLVPNGLVPLKLESALTLGAQNTSMLTKPIAPWSTITQLSIAFSVGRRRLNA